MFNKQHKCLCVSVGLLWLAWALMVGWVIKKEVVVGVGAISIKLDLICVYKATAYMIT